MVTLKQLAYIFLILLLSCNVADQKCSNSDNNILYHSTIDKERDHIVPCKADYDPEIFLNQHENILSTFKHENFCHVPDSILIHLNILTGYREDYNISWSDYIVDFHQNFIVNYMGNFSIGLRNYLCHLFFITSVINDSNFYTKELFMAIEKDKIITFIIKVGSFSNNAPDYVNNSFIVYNDGIFTYYELFSLSDTLDDINKMNQDEYICSSFGINEDGKIVLY